MKGGQTPIHVMRFAVADYLEDPWVKLALTERNLVATTFYPLFLFASFNHGGDLPSDPTLLAAALGMRRSDVVAALKFWSQKECGLVILESGRAWNPRVRRDVAAELQFRSDQAERGRKGGKAKAASERLAGAKQPPSPPSPSPSPAPAPAPTPSSTNAGAGGRAATDPIAGPPEQAAGGAPGWLLDHDPSDPVETRLASRVAHLTQLTAKRDGQADPKEILAAVSATPSGNMLDHIRGAPAAWVEASVDACDAFEADNFGPETEPGS